MRRMDPFSAAARPVVMGHRGSPLRHPENTPASFAAAAAEGATWVELDARLAADGVVVVHHDPVLADGRPICGLPSSGLAAVGVADLASVLDGLPAGLGVDVECKNLPGDPDFDEDERLAAAVADLLAARAGQRPTMTSSFNPMTVQALAAAVPDVPAGLLHVPTLALDAAAELAAEVGARLLCPHVDADLDEASVGAAHEAGFGVLVWTVDDPARARALAGAGVDALCTNDPAGLVAALRS
jgi:glycerophosphoryl diester phosphodiesterase